MAKVYSIRKGFSKNYEFLQTVHKLIKSFRFCTSPLDSHVNCFLTEYSNYSPQVLVSDVQKLGSLWDVMIEKSCDILFSENTAVSSIPITFHENHDVLGTFKLMPSFSLYFLYKLDCSSRGCWISSCQSLPR